MIISFAGKKWGQFYFRHDNQFSRNIFLLFSSQMGL